MQLIFVLAAAIAFMYYYNLIPASLMLPLPLFGAVVFTCAFIYAIRKA